MRPNRMLRAATLAILLLMVSVAGFAQNAPDVDAPIIRVTTTLVQIDAVVTDKQGKPVTGLTKEDFQILQDGKSRDITYFSPVIVTLAANTPKSSRARKTNEPAPPSLTTAPVKREQIRRTVAILVNDLNLAFEDVARARTALRRFLDEDIGEGDLVALASASGGMGMYSQFTTNRELLKAAADRINWFPRTPAPADSQSILLNYPSSLLNQPVMSEETRALRSASIGALRLAIQGLKGMPGRKSIVLMGSDDSRVDKEFELMLEPLVDEATRTSVTIYAIDLRGVQTLALKAESAREDRAPDLFGPGLALFRSQGAKTLLAERTGGLFYKNDNDLHAGLAQALEDQSSYYLLGYNPGKGSFNKEFHKIEVKVLRTGLLVRSRAGYIGAEDTPPRRKPESIEQQTVRELLAPFQATDIRTRLASLFGTNAKGQFVESALLIDGNDLQFEPGPGGKYESVFEVMVAGFDTQGRLTDQVATRYRASLTEDQLRAARQYGLSYSLSYAVTKPGPYHVRIAVRDLKSFKLGTATQFLMVPDLSKKQLALSGIMVVEPPSAAGRYPLSTPILRVFKSGREMAWQAQVFNPKLKQDEPSLESSLRIFREGQLVAETPAAPVPLDPKLPKKPKDLMAAGSIVLPAELKPGEYALQVLVKDQNDGSKLVAQAIDFRIVE